jgi:hypothetical protein
MPSIDIDLDDFYWECSDRDKEKLLEWLEEDGFTPEPVSLGFPIPKNYLDREWEDIITKLAMSRIQLTIEEEEAIKKIYKRIS